MRYQEHSAGHLKRWLRYGFLGLLAGLSAWSVGVGREGGAAPVQEIGAPPGTIAASLPPEASSFPSPDKLPVAAFGMAAGETRDREAASLPWVSPEEFADPGSDFWKGFGLGLLTLPVPGTPVEAARLVVARQVLSLYPLAPELPKPHPIPAVLAFYEVPNDLQMQLHLPAPWSYRYLGATAPQQVEFCVPGAGIERAQRIPVERCGLIHVLAMNAAGSTRLVLSFTPAGSFKLLTEPGGGPLRARIYKGGGLGLLGRPRPAPLQVKATQVGLASWYGSRFQGRRTASGEKFNVNANTAAHRTLPLGTKARVTNLHNGKSTIVRITDRGPFSRRRIIDVSRGVADRLGFRGRGTARVKVEVLEPAKGRK